MPPIPLPRPAGADRMSVVDPVELVILVGIQASGKTTYYRRRLADRYLHVSLDHWRGKGNVRAKERAAIDEAMDQAADDDTLRGVAVDNTNTTGETRRRYFDIAREFAARTGRGVRVIAIFFDEPLEACQARNAARPVDPPVGEPYFVPPAAIASFHSRLQPPSRDEAFDEVRRVRVTEDGSFVVDGDDG